MRCRGIATALVAALTLVGTAHAAPSVQPAYSFQNPFDPQECERAIHFGSRLLSREPSSRRASTILAEGWLCKGLDDNPTALDVAIGLLRQRVAEEPSNFFAQIELADAIRSRFPLSVEARSALRQATEALASADVGMARQRLAGYINENQAAMEQQRVQTLPLVQRRLAELKAGTLSPTDMAGLVILLAATGPDGVTQAQSDLETYLGVHHDDVLATLYRAEILRARGQIQRCPPLYKKAVVLLCHDTPPSSTCALARWRLEQLRQQTTNEPNTAASDPRN